MVPEKADGRVKQVAGGDFHTCLSFLICTMGLCQDLE